MAVYVPRKDIPLDKIIYEACDKFQKFAHEEAERGQYNLSDRNMVRYYLEKIASEGKNIFDPVTEAIRKTFNLKSFSLTLYSNLDINLYASIVQKNISAEKMADYEKSQLNYSGINPVGKNVNPEHPFTGFVEEIYNALNKTNNTVLDPEIIDKYLAFGIYIEVLIFCHDIIDIPETRKTEKLTIGNITAAILHEIGHVAKYISSFSDSFHRVGILKRSIVHLKKDIAEASPEKAFTYLKDAALVYNKTEEDEKNKKIVETIVSDEKIKKSPSLLKLIFNGIIQIVMFPIILGLITATLSQMLVFHGLKRNMTYLKLSSLRKEKTSDIINTLQNYKTDENAADEFASLYGRGAELSGGLIKMFNMNGNEKLVQANLFTMMISFYLDASMILASSLPMGLSSHMYETYYKRLEVGVESIAIVLKDPNISPMMRREFLLRYEEANETLNKIKSQKSITNKTYNLLDKTLNIITSFNTITGTLKDANLLADYQRLQETTNSLINNSFYVKAAKIRSTFDN